MAKVNCSLSTELDTEKQTIPFVSYSLTSYCKIRYQWYFEFLYYIKLSTYTLYHSNKWWYGVAYSWVTLTTVSSLSFLVLVLLSPGTQLCNFEYSCPYTILSIWIVIGQGPPCFTKHRTCIFFVLLCVYVCVFDTRWRNKS